MAKSTAKSTQPGQGKQKAGNAGAQAGAEKPAAETTNTPDGAVPAPAAANQSPDAAPKGDKAKVTAFLVVSKRDGFRRAGRAWPKTETRIEADELSEDQVAAIMDEPMLTVMSVVD